LDSELCIACRLKKLLPKSRLRPNRLAARKLEDAEDYKAFEAAIIADYDAQSAVERELVLRLASLLWRLRRATTMETGLFEIQADHLNEFRQARKVNPASREALYALFGRADTVSFDTNSHGITNGTKALPNPRPKSVDPAVDTTRNFARCFLRLANPTSHSIALADMKRPCGARPARSCLLSMY
jgi:hypothetical protein